MKKSGSQNETSANRQILRRTLVLMGVCGILTFAILAVRLFKLQIIDHERYEQAAIDQQVRETTVTASRGTIYDRSGNVMAISASTENVYLNPNYLNKQGEDAAVIAAGLASILGLDYEAVYTKATNTGSYYVTVATQLEQDKADEVRAFITDNGINSIYLEPSTKRYYPYQSTASHLLGFVGTENTGLGGTEAYYDDYLTGTNGRIVRLKSSNGTDMLFEQYEDIADAEDGDDVYYTIDVNIQQIIEKHLEQAIADYDVQNGAAAIAMNPKTGEILAMASKGDFDPNNYQVLSDQIQEEIAQLADPEEQSDLTNEELQKMWRNKAVSDTYEPGSTFKIITLSMALEEGVVSESDSFYCGGSIAVPGRDSAVNCWKHAGHGTQTLQQVIQHSCNVGTVMLAEKVGGEKFYEYVNAYGFFDRTGVDVIGESSSYWWSQEDWDAAIDKNNLSSLAAASFGQTFNITPIQLITAISAAVNGGNLMEPYVVSQVVSAEGETVYSHEPTVVRQVISEETSARVREILESVVGDSTEGTGKNAAVTGYRIGGKTGTSEKVGQQIEDEYIVSFVGFAPADDPEIIILTLLDTPSDESGIYISGGQMAAPTVGNMMSEILPYLGVQATYTDEEAQRSNASVPYVKNYTLDEATAALKAEGFTVRTVGSGDTVTAQVPSPGASVLYGSEVILYMGAEVSEEETTVPDISGMSYAAARNTLQSYGFYMRTTGVGLVSDSVTVSKQSIAAGETAVTGTIVEVTFSDQSDLGRY